MADVCEARAVFRDYDMLEGGKRRILSCIIRKFGIDIRCEVISSSDHDLEFLTEGHWNLSYRLNDEDTELRSE